MFSVELAAKANEVRDNVGWDDNVVFNQRRHRRLLQLFDDFGCTDHRLTQSCVLHVEAFKFRFFFGEQVEGGLVRCNGWCCFLSNLGCCCFFFIGRGFVNRFCWRFLGSLLGGLLWSFDIRCFRCRFFCC